MCVPMDGFHLSNMELARLGLADRKGAAGDLRRMGVRAPAAPDPRGRGAGVRARLQPGAQRVDRLGGARLPVGGAGRGRGQLPVAARGSMGTGETAVRPRRLSGRSGRGSGSRLVRRQRARGLDAAAALDWVQRSDEANARLVATTRSYADLVLRRTWCYLATWRRPATARMMASSSEPSRAGTRPSTVYPRPIAAGQAGGEPEQQGVDGGHRDHRDRQWTDSHDERDHPSHAPGQHL